MADPAAMTDGGPIINVQLMDGGPVINVELFESGPVIYVELSGPKPAGGIPREDLAEDVRLSLSKADTAYQAPGSGIPAADIARGVIPAAAAAAPEPLGTPAPGTSAKWAREDHVHKMPGAADVGAVPAGSVQFKIYDSVTDLELISGSATVAGAYAAMPENCILLCNTGDFAAGEFPTGFYGTLEIIKRLANGARGVITAYGKLDSHGDLRKAVTANNVPESDWVRLPGKTVDATVTRVFSGTLSNDATALQCDGHLAILSLNVRYSTGFSTEGWTDLYTVSPAPINTVYFSMDFQGKSATVRILSASDASKPGYVQILAHTVAYTAYARYVIPYFY